MEKERLDILVFNKGLAPSREQAKRLIMEGKIRVDSDLSDKPGMTFPVDSKIELVGEKMPYVSRGGFKLEKAIREFDIDLSEKHCIDIGASTGGFTDCMLQNGASHVTSVDVGYGQLDYRLRTDKRVTVMERTNFRYLKPSDLTEKMDFFSCDVSFISLSKVLPAVRPIMKDEGEGVCLIKPQFEAGKEKVGKKGVVRDPDIHIEVINNVFSYIKESGFFVKGLSFSPIKGPEGNIEYLVFVSTSQEELFSDSVEDIVAEAFNALK